MSSKQSKPTIKLKTSSKEKKKLRDRPQDSKHSALIPEGKSKPKKSRAVLSEVIKKEVRDAKRRQSMLEDFFNYHQKLAKKTQKWDSLKVRSVESITKEVQLEMNNNKVNVATGSTKSRRFSAPPIVKAEKKKGNSPRSKLVRSPKEKMVQLLNLHSNHLYSSEECMDSKNMDRKMNTDSIEESRERFLKKMDLQTCSHCAKDIVLENVSRSKFPPKISSSTIIMEEIKILSKAIMKELQENEKEKTKIAHIDNRGKKCKIIEIQDKPEITEKPITKKSTSGRRYKETQSEISHAKCVEAKETNTSEISNAKCVEAKETNTSKISNPKCVEVKETNTSEISNAKYVDPNTSEISSGKCLELKETNTNICDSGIDFKKICLDEPKDVYVASHTGTDDVKINERQNVRSRNETRFESKRNKLKQNDGNKKEIKRNKEDGIEGTKENQVSKNAEIEQKESNAENQSKVTLNKKHITKKTSSENETIKNKKSSENETIKNKSSSENETIKNKTSLKNKIEEMLSRFEIKIENDEEMLAIQKSLTDAITTRLRQNTKITSQSEIKTKQEPHFGVKTAKWFLKEIKSNAKLSRNCELLTKRSEIKQKLLMDAINERNNQINSSNEELVMEGVSQTSKIDGATTNDNAIILKSNEESHSNEEKSDISFAAEQRLEASIVTDQKSEACKHGNAFPISEASLVECNECKEVEISVVSFEKPEISNICTVQEDNKTFRSRGETKSLEGLRISTLEHEGSGAVRSGSYEKMSTIETSDGKTVGLGEELAADDTMERSKIPAAADTSRKSFKDKTTFEIAENLDSSSSNNPFEILRKSLTMAENTRRLSESMNMYDMTGINKETEKIEFYLNRLKVKQNELLQTDIPEVSDSQEERIFSDEVNKDVQTFVPSPDLSSNTTPSVSQSNTRTTSEASVHPILLIAMKLSKISERLEKMLQAEGDLPCRNQPMVSS